MSTAAGNVAVDLGADSVSVTSTESIFQVLDGNVPDAFKQKIINGEYIDLGQLLQRRPGPDKSKCLTIEDEHQVVQSKPFTMKIHLALFSLRTESDNPDATCELSP